MATRSSSGDAPAGMAGRRRGPAVVLEIGAAAAVIGYGVLINRVVPHEL